LALVALLTAHTVLAQVSGTVRILATDQQHLPLPTAEVTIKAAASAWLQTALANLEGEAVFPTVPVGQYVVTVTFESFSPAERQIVVASNTVTPVTVQLQIAGLAETVEVAAVIQRINPESSRTETVVGRNDIIRDPGADQNGSLAMITNNAPGAYMLHDHLHSRGGHGVSWEIDGVPVPSSAMAVVGSQFDPKDVESLEINRGGLSTNLGDRPYGVFNVVPRSGFEASRFGDVTATYGSHQLGSIHASRLVITARIRSSPTSRARPRIAPTAASSGWPSRCCTTPPMASPALRRSSTTNRATISSDSSARHGVTASRSPTRSGSRRSGSTTAKPGPTASRI